MVLRDERPAAARGVREDPRATFAIGVSGVGRFRVELLLPTVGMVLPPDRVEDPDRQELNLPPIIKTLAMTKRGIIIFGATGTGNRRRWRR